MCLWHWQAIKYVIGKMLWKVYTVCIQKSFSAALDPFSPKWGSICIWWKRGVGLEIRIHVIDLTIEICKWWDGFSSYLQLFVHLLADARPRKDGVFASLFKCLNCPFVPLLNITTGAGCCCIARNLHKSNWEYSMNEEGGGQHDKILTFRYGPG